MAGQSIFRQFAPMIACDLMRELSISKMDADAINGNAGHESAGFSQLRQIGGGDGIGICQWSGARHYAYVNFCKGIGQTPLSIQAGVRFLIHELKTTEADALKAVKAAANLYAKTVAFERVFERAGVPALVSRYQWAELSASLPVAEKGLLNVAVS